MHLRVMQATEKAFLHFPSPVGTHTVLQLESRMPYQVPHQNFQGPRPLDVRRVMLELIADSQTNASTNS